MGAYPADFSSPLDQGGPGQGQPVGGFGGNAGTDRQSHRTVVQQVGKAPVLLVHGNAGTAETPPWDLLDAKRMLLAAGYVEELIWAPSYLGDGTLDLLTPHTNNVDDVRDYLDSVCAYLAVDVVDVIAHSLGCSLVYAVCRGLERRPAPINWNQPKRWHRIGTFVALAGAFHGLGTASPGEWQTGGEFMTELLDEELGGGGENPYGVGKDVTPPPQPHNITYFCGIAQGDFIDAQNPGTGQLDGAINRAYSLGAGITGHERIKENQAVFDDFLPHLNSVPPAPVVEVGTDRDSGTYPGPLVITIAVDPPERAVYATASRVNKRFMAGFVADKVFEAQHLTLLDGASLTLASSGMWQLTLRVDGAADDVARTYWIDVPAVVTTIHTDNSEPFEDSLRVLATADEPAAAVYHSLDGVHWNAGAAVTITEDAVVSFVAITPDKLASETVSRSFHKATHEVTASVDALLD